MKQVAVNKCLRGMAIVVFATLLMLISPALAKASGPVIDGQFADWNGVGHITDPIGDGPPDADIVLFAWASYAGQDGIAFMIARRPVPDKPDPVIYYHIYIDTNGNGSMNDPNDRRIDVTYHPKKGTADVVIEVYRGSGGRISTRGGRGESLEQGGARVEFAVPFADLGINGNQKISMFLTASLQQYSAPVDRAPDSGTITWTPIPALGVLLIGLLAAGGIFLVWYRRGRWVWSQPSASSSS